ncbi:hypothetical protein QBC35DRAFT_478798 [Podospora australis]|uniref:Uncharacterized protein n=1 Tax=Podospora australis TaxID=1536484 RepID=A0AAN7AD28_9PEZI|nr:hypothetical protein QBC35DRAFT_478798 [Podospora australis]
MVFTSELAVDGIRSLGAEFIDMERPTNDTIPISKFFSPGTLSGYDTYESPLPSSFSIESDDEEYDRYIYDLDRLEFEETAYLTTHRYLPGRPIEGNPRAKHHTRPLPWGRKKLAKVSAWDEDKLNYERYLFAKQKQAQEKRDEDRWAEQRQQELKRREEWVKRHRVYVPNTSNHPTWDLRYNQEIRWKRSTKNKQLRTQEKEEALRREKERRQKLHKRQREGNQRRKKRGKGEGTRIDNSHFLAQLKADACRHRVIYVGCNCCWRMEQKKLSRSYRRRVDEIEVLCEEGKELVEEMLRGEWDVESCWGDEGEDDDEVFPDETGVRLADLLWGLSGQDDGEQMQILGLEELAKVEEGMLDVCLLERAESQFSWEADLNWDSGDDSEDSEWSFLDTEE